MLTKRVKIIGTWVISSVAAISSFIAFLPTLRSGITYTHNFFDAVEFVISNRETIEHIMLDDQTAHEMYGKVYGLEGRMDSTRMHIKVLSSSKFPYDSMWVHTNSGWRRLHRSTPWIWMRDPDR